MKPLTGCIGSFKSPLTTYCMSTTRRYRFSSACCVLATLLLGAGVSWPAYGTPRDKSPASRASTRSSQPRAVPQEPERERRSAGLKLVIKVVDENGVAVPSAVVTVEGTGAQKTLKSETDYAGRIEFDGLDSGLYKIRIEKEGFYAKIIDQESADGGQVIEIVLDHQQEVKEVMDVQYSPPTIDPAKTAATEHLSSQELINVPYPASRDIKQAFVLMPGIVKD